MSPETIFYVSVGFIAIYLLAYRTGKFLEKNGTPTLGWISLFILLDIMLAGSTVGLLRQTIIVIRSF
jgi:hypothetical protein